MSARSAPCLERVVALARSVLDSVRVLLGSAQVSRSLTLQTFAEFTAKLFQWLNCKKIALCL